MDSKKTKRRSQMAGSDRSRRSKEKKEKESSDSEEEEKPDRQAIYNGIVKQWKERKMRRSGPSNGRFRFKTTLRNTILDVFRSFGWKETDSETEWDIYWTDRSWMRGVYDRIHLDPHQRINHFRNYYELTRKDLMVKNLKRARRALMKQGGIDEANQYNFFPETYNLPDEYMLFVEAFKREEKNKRTWIMKPCARCQGKGIFLFDKLSQISEWRNDYRWKPDNPSAEKYVVQTYIHNPLLVGGKKFDLRLYVMVTDYHPLTVYMYRDGFARFASTRFTMNKDNRGDDFAHLTNVAIQKKGDDYNSDTGGKWDLRSLKLHLVTKYGHARVNQLFCEIQLVIIRSLLSVSKIMINDKNCFSLYGYDIMIDDNLKVWLIEINAAPSLTANTPADYAMKFALLEDMLTIVDMDAKLTGDEDQVGGFDLIYRGGFVKFDHNCTFTTYLGCHNNRDKQLVKLHKQLMKKKQQSKTASTNGSSK